MRVSHHVYSFTVTDSSPVDTHERVDQLWLAGVKTVRGY